MDERKTIEEGRTERNMKAIDKRDKERNRANIWVMASHHLNLLFFIIRIQITRISAYISSARC